MKRYDSQPADQPYGPNQGEVSQMLALQAEKVAEYLLPNGKRIHNRWVCGNVQGDEGESLKVKLTGDKAGKWKDYATDEYGDLLDLWGVTRHRSPPIAFAEAREYLGQPIGKHPSLPKPATAIQPVKQTEELKTIWTWQYPEKDGISGKAVRKENAAGEKVVLPYFLRDNDLKSGIEPNFIPPLYGQASEKYTFIVEGEKCANAMLQMGLPAITSQGGSGAAYKADWSVLDDTQTIYLLPDNDKTGMMYMQAVAKALESRKADRTIKQVNLPDLPDKGDIVDWIQARLPDWDGYSQDPRIASLKDNLRELVLQATPVKLEQSEQIIAPRFNLIRANDIDLTPPDWLVEKYIEREAIIFLYGDTEAFKTFICIDLACAIAGGHDWGAGCKVKQGPVVYVCGEGAKGIRRRLAAWELHHKKPIPDNLFVSSCSTDLADPTAISVLTGELEALPGPPAAIMVDTFARNYSGSENENTDIAAFYNAVEASLVKPFSSTVLVTHHPGKNISLGPRGGASIKQNSDAMFKVTRTDSGDQMFTTLHSEKMKDAERPVDVMFEAMEYPLGFKDSFGNESTSLALDYVSTVERQMIAAADKKDAAKEAEDHRKELLQEIIEDPTLIQVDYAARTDLSPATVSRYMKKLRADKHLKGNAGRLEVTAKGKEWCRCRSVF